MNRFVAQNVLELFAHASHAVLAMKGEHHHEPAVEEDAFHNDIKSDEISHEPLNTLCGVRRKIHANDIFSQLQLKRVLLPD